jgi:hypothetical protein
MRDFAAIVAGQSLAKVVRAACVEVPWIALALQNVVKLAIFLLACRAVARNSRVPWTLCVRLRRGSCATAFALHYIASEGIIGASLRMRVQSAT